MDTKQAETVGNRVVQLILREQRAVKKLRWVLSADLGDLEQWRQGEDAARFVADLESASAPRCLECDRPLTKDDPPETDKCKSCYEDYEL